MLGFCSLACEDPEHGDIRFFFGFGDSRNWKTEWLSGIPWYMVYCTYIILYLHLVNISCGSCDFLW